MDFKGLKVAIVPCSALGDVTIYLRLAWIFTQAGAQVRFFSGALFPAREYFEWLQVEADRELCLTKLSSENDLVISYVNWLARTAEHVPGLLAHDNIAYVTAKKLPRALALDGRGVSIHGQHFAGASRAFCLESRAGWSMVQWVDSYARDVFGLTCDQPIALRLPGPPVGSERRIAIFPTTPHAKKNYSARGFSLLARQLSRQGWFVEFVCMPHERELIAARYPGSAVHSFDDVKQLMNYLATTSVVISNDSGGGHLGSLMGLRTFTITRKYQNFVWRPGFNECNQVLAPLFSFKFFGKYVWRPFVPVWRIASILSRSSMSTNS